MLHKLTSYDGSLEVSIRNPISMKEPTLFVLTMRSFNIILKKEDLAPYLKLVQYLQMKANSTRWVVLQNKEEA
jgi:hypothetical protein